MLYSEVRYQPERTKTYLGSPSIVRLADGALVATHDYFGRGCPRNHEREEALTSVYRSEDDGRTWINITHIMNAYWGSLFVHGGALYHLGVSQQYGSIVIRRSDDGGFTWTHPADERTGLLFRGGYYHDDPNYHCAPVPICVHHGRIYRAFEDCENAIWGRGFQSCVVSAPVDADLLDAANWRLSNKIRFDPAWVPAAWGKLDNPGWLEGNVVAAPDGTLWNILRFHSTPLIDKAAMIRIDESGARQSFDPGSGFIDFPGGLTKFTIRRDETLGRYLALCNANDDPEKPCQRNVLSLCASDDLRNWQVIRVLLRDESGLEWELSRRLTGFQYVDWQFDGDDLIYLVRMAWRGAHNFHDANRITFHVLRNYRELFAAEHRPGPNTL
jgi:hypothetical protein